MRGSNPTINFKAGAIALAVGAATFLPVDTSLAQGIELEEIIVTAQRREQAIEEVPVSVTTMRGERLTSLFEAGEDIRALATRLPGLYAESSNGRLAPRFYMRGLGNTDFDLAASQSVSVLFDEVVQENVILKSFPIFDIDRVEVLRGPQGTLFGRNTPAGIVKFDTRKPSEDFNAYALVTAGNRGTLNIEGAVGGALNDEGTIMGRFSVLSQSRDDWIDNVFTGEYDAMGGYDEVAWRGQLLLEPSDDLSVLLNVHGRDYDGTASIFRANVLDTGSNSFNSNYDRDGVFFDEGENNPQEAQALGGMLRIEMDLGDGIALTSITGIETVENRSEGDIDGGFGASFMPIMGPGFIPFPSHSADGLDELDQFTQEVHISGEGESGFFWQTGFFYFDSDFTVFTNPFFLPESRLNHTNTAWAFFGQMSLPLNDALTLTAGVRHTDDEKEMVAFNPPITQPDVQVKGERASFDVSLMWDINEDVNVYGRVANGFRAPSIQGRDIAFASAPASIANDESIMSYEVGVKASAAEGRINVNAAAFQYTIDDMQLTAIGGLSNAVQLINADEGKAVGFDMDFSWLVTDNFVINAGYSIVDTEINDGQLVVPPCGSGQCTPTDLSDGNGNAVVDGNPFPGAPDSTFNLSARYGFATDSGEIFRLRRHGAPGLHQLLPV